MTLPVFRLYSFVSTSLFLIPILACSHVASDRTHPKSDPSPAISAQGADRSSFESVESIRSYLAKIEHLEEIERAERSRQAEARWRAEHGPFEVMPVVGDGVGAIMAPQQTSAVAFDSASLEAYGVSDLSSSGLDAIPNLDLSSSSESITNNQEVGVDEGDIVKRVGEYLILLRRGRLFSVEIGDESGDPIRLIDRQDVFPFDYPHDAWYDELLVVGSRLVVLGYSYETRAMEIAVFEVDWRGRVSHVDSYALRSNDYWSTDNYGGRLVDGELVFYMPIDIRSLSRGDGRLWPTYARFSEEGIEDSWSPLVREMEIVKPTQAGLPTTIHAVVKCGFDGLELECAASGLVGDWNATHYVSREAVYLWIAGGPADFDSLTISDEEFLAYLRSGEGVRDRRGNSGALYRVPLDGGLVGMVAVEGEPINQFSFREGPDALDLMLTLDRNPESYEIDREWVRIPISRFYEADPIVFDDERVVLPGPRHEGWCPAHRFISRYLLYASCGEDSDDRDDRFGVLHDASPDYGVYVIDLASGGESDWISTSTSINRVERVGTNALLVGGGHPQLPKVGGLELIPVLLRGEVTPSRVLSRAHLYEIEERSHAFNYKKVGRDGTTLMGLPAMYVDPNSIQLLESGNGWEIYKSDRSNLISFFSMDGAGRIEEIGRLVETPAQDSADDDCEVSCLDWYGSFRPIFIGDRIFGLLDYEFIEARLEGRQLIEVQRSAVIRAD